MVSVIMLNVFYSECSYAECHIDERHYDECQGARIIIYTYLVEC
jgi:hypothetical protein